MNKKTIILLLAIVLSISSFGQRKEKKLVQQSFDNYKSAILNGNGVEAIKYVDSRTFSYYSDILDKTKNADSLALDSLDAMDKLIILSVRHRATKKEILAFNGKTLLIYAIKEGLISKNSVENSKIGDVKIDGDFAKGQFVVNGKKAPLYFHFYKENKAWKVDLTSVFPMARAAFRQMIDESRVEENKYLLMLLEITTGKKANKDIWEIIQK